MTDNCREVKRKIDRWLELSTPEIDAVKNHAKGCSHCRQALASIKPALDALDRSAEAYDQMTYAGPVPALPEHQPALVERWPCLSKVGWATALAATICFLVWFGSKVSAPRDVTERPSMAGALRIPIMPRLDQSRISLPMTPGALGRRIPKPQYPIGPSLQRHIGMPKKPETLHRDPQKNVSRH
jgi:anti-sigma factor RsiW